MNKKKQVLSEIFLHCKKEGNFTFHNDLVREVALKINFKNLFDVTKIDNVKKIPDIIREEDYFLIHLGNGYHQFIQNIDDGYHQFEAIAEQDCIDWKYQKSLLNETDTSESNILSLGSNQGIISDFLYAKSSGNPKVYNARRTKITLDYYIGNKLIEAKNLQLEVDMTMELDGVVTVFEAKNGFHDNFSIYQLFYPYLYYRFLKKRDQLAIREINCCYLLRKQSRNKDSSQVRVYLYNFTRENDLSSIKFIKAKQYNLRVL